MVLRLSLFLLALAALPVALLSDSFSFIWMNLDSEQGRTFIYSILTFDSSGLLHGDQYVPGYGGGMIFGSMAMTHSTIDTRFLDAWNDLRLYALGEAPEFITYAEKLSTQMFEEKFHLELAEKTRRERRRIIKAEEMADVDLQELFLKFFEKIRFSYERMSQLQPKILNLKTVVQESYKLASESGTEAIKSSSGTEATKSSTCTEATKSSTCTEATKSSSGTEATKSSSGTEATKSSSEATKSSSNTSITNKNTSQSPNSTRTSTTPGTPAIPRMPTTTPSSIASSPRTTTKSAATTSAKSATTPITTPSSSRTSSQQTISESIDETQVVEDEFKKENNNENNSDDNENNSEAELMTDCLNYTKNQVVTKETLDFVEFLGVVEETAPDHEQKIDADDDHLEEAETPKVKPATQNVTPPPEEESGPSTYVIIFVSACCIGSIVLFSVVSAFFLMKDRTKVYVFA